MSLYVAILPFGLAICFIALSPLFTRRAKKYIEGQIREDAAKAGRNPDNFPPEVAVGTVKDYIDLAADSVQLWPLTLLPLTGALFAITGNIASNAALTILVGIVIITIALDAWMLTRAPQEYASRRLARLSIASVIQIIGNVLSIALLWIFS